MTQAELAKADWQAVVDGLGGAAGIAAKARETKAFCGRGRSPMRSICCGLCWRIAWERARSTAAWASATGLADLSNVGLLYRLRHCGDWLAALVAERLAASAPPASHGRLIRLIDATAVPQAGTGARQRNHLWRIHSAFDLPSERFGSFVLTDQKGGERLDRVAVVTGEIRIADRADMQPERIAAVLAAGGDVLVRSGWKNAGWLDADGTPLDLIGELGRHAEAGLVDRPVWVRRHRAPALALRLVAVKKPPQAAGRARCMARRQAQKGGHRIADNTLTAADRVILVTSLPAADFPSADVLALYRLRWLIELAFERLKSLVGLKGPPGFDKRSPDPSSWRTCC